MCFSVIVPHLVTVFLLYCERLGMRSDSFAQVYIKLSVVNCRLPGEKGALHFAKKVYYSACRGVTMMYLPCGAGSLVRPLSVFLHPGLL